MSTFYDKAKYTPPCTLTEPSENERVSVLITEITAPGTPATNVTVGLPVVIGDALAGIAGETPAAATSNITVFTGGKFCIYVTLASAGHFGDALYINPTTGIVSDSKVAGQIPFARLLDGVSTTATPTKALVMLPGVHPVQTDNT